MNSFEHWESSNLSLKENILRGIYSYGYETPSSIQKKKQSYLLQKVMMLSHNHNQEQEKQAHI